jgi:hypothetical protein
MSKIFTNKYFLIPFFLLIILASVYFIGKSAGKIGTPKHKKLPNGGSGISNGFDPAVQGKELYSVMKGVFTFGSTKDIAFAKLLSLSDDELTAVYNWFNTEYASEDQGTMYEWISNEEMFKSGVHLEILQKMRYLKLV